MYVHEVFTISWKDPSGNKNSILYERTMRQGLVWRRSRNISHRGMCILRTLTCLHRTDSGPRPRHIACNIHCLFHGSLNSDTLFPCFLCKFTITPVVALKTSREQYRGGYSFSLHSVVVKWFNFSNLWQYSMKRLSCLVY